MILTETDVCLDAGFLTNYTNRMGKRFIEHKNTENAFIQFFTSMPKEKNRFGLRVLLVFIGVICQGFGVYWLNKVKFGTDPCTVLNMAVSQKVGLSYGTTLLIFNIILFLFVLLFGIREIGIGTLANMVVVGYTVDFCEWIFRNTLTDEFFAPMKTRIGILIPALIWFIFAAALYMAVDLGQSPYDAAPAIIASKLPKIPFTYVRIAWDVFMTLAGFLLGGTVGVVTVAIALFLGPAITFCKNMLRKIFGFK